MTSRHHHASYYREVQAKHEKANQASRYLFQCYRLLSSSQIDPVLAVLNRLDFESWRTPKLFPHIYCALISLLALLQPLHFNYFSPTFFVYRTSNKIALFRFKGTVRQN